MKPRIKRIYMAWRAGRSRSRIIVGVIKANSSSVVFNYIKEGVDKAAQDGFVCFPDFPDTSKTYDVNILRVLSQRLNNADRTDIGEYYSFWNVREKYKDDKMCILAQTGGILPTDNFEFLPDFYGVKDLAIVSELTGLSGNPLNNGDVEEGDALTWKLEPQNKFDNEAVAIYKGERKIGYVKKIHNRMFHKKGSHKLSVRVKRIEHNGHINKVFMNIVYTR